MIQVTEVLRHLPLVWEAGTVCASDHFCQHRSGRFLLTLFDLIACHSDPVAGKMPTHLSNAEDVVHSSGIVHLLTFSSQRE